MPFLHTENSDGLVLSLRTNECSKELCAECCWDNVHARGGSIVQPPPLSLTQYFAGRLSERVNLENEQKEDKGKVPIMHHA